ncbi:hypothetical protein IB680_00350 [Francisella philomiragia]|uniref:hypothetical protein n=1 Tax=Francisella philomiragia TaxID=28110 RepID=UPI000B58B34F|nr:hypothetical protein [Francisella philomiragia]MBK2094146.1 hypothetical protein [Francisella philomiragia]
MISKIFRNIIALVLSIFIFTVLIKLDYGYVISSFISIFSGLFLRVYLYKNYQFIYQKALLILFVSFISIYVQSFCLQVLDLQLRFSQLIAIVFCYVIYSVLDKYIECICKFIVKILKVFTAISICGSLISVKTINSPSTEKWLVRIIWVISAGMVFFVIAYMIPHRGFDYTDNGYYLYNVINLTNSVVPGAGYAALLNLMPKVLGLNYYLTYELYYSIVATLSLFLFFYAFNMHRSIFLPIGVVFVLTCNLNYILNYQSAAQFLLTASFALILIGNKKKSLFLTFLAVVLLAISCFVNISLMPATLPCLLLLLLVYRKKRLHFLLYIITVFILALFYLSSDVNVFQHSGIAHEDRSYIFTQTLAFLKLVFSPLMLVVITISGFVRYISKKHRLSKYVSIILYILGILVLLCFEYSALKGGFRWSYNNLYPLFYFKFVLFQGAILALVLFFDIKDSSSYKNLLFCVITFIFMFGISVTTKSPAISHLVMLAGAYTAASLVLVALYVEKNFQSFVFAKSLMAYFLLLIAAISLFISTNSNYRAESIFKNNTVITTGLLAGVYSTKDKANSYSDIVDFYENNSCSAKPFFAVPSLPLVYVIFNRTAYGNQAWVSPDVGNEVTINELLKNVKSLNQWCVVMAPSYNAAPKEFTKEFEDYITTNSKKCYVKDYVEDGSGNTPKQLVLCVK